MKPITVYDKAKTSLAVIATGVALGAASYGATSAFNVPIDAAYDRYFREGECRRTQWAWSGPREEWSRLAAAFAESVPVNAALKPWVLRLYLDSFNDCHELYGEGK